MQQSPSKHSLRSQIIWGHYTHSLKLEALHAELVGKVAVWRREAFLKQIQRYRNRILANELASEYKRRQESWNRSQLFWWIPRRIWRLEDLEAEEQAAVQKVQEQKQKVLEEITETVPRLGPYTWGLDMDRRRHLKLVPVWKSPNGKKKQLCVKRWIWALAIQY